MNTIAAPAATTGPPERSGDPRGRSRGRDRFGARHGLTGLMSGLTVFSLLLLVWQIALWNAPQVGFGDLRDIAAIHLVSCSGLAVWLIWRSMHVATENRYGTALQMVAWSLVAGPFGSFVAVALLLPPARESFEPSDGEIDVLPAHGADNTRAQRIHRAVRDRRVHIERACQVRPLIDVVAEGLQSEKLDALALMYKRYDVKLSAVLKQALRDPDMSVRVLAATVMAKLNAIYGRKIGDCQQAAVAWPNMARNWREIATARLAYAESGLLETQRARAEIETAIGDLLRAIELDASDRESYEFLSRARRRIALWSIQELELPGSP